MSELSISELETQHGEPLPAREALGLCRFRRSFNSRFNVVNFTQSANAINILSERSTAIALNIAFVNPRWTG